MNPINYSGIQSPNNVIQQAMSGYRLGAGIRDDRQKQEALVQQQQQAQSMQNDLAELANNPNAGAEDYQRLMVRNPQIREHLTKSFEFMDKEEKANNVKFATEVYAATHTGNIDLAKSMLEGRRDAAKNSGDEKDAATASALIKMIEANPNTAKTTLGIVLAGAGGEEFAKIQERLANVSKTNAETETIDATRSSDVDLVDAKSEKERGLANQANAGATRNIADANKADAQTETIDATRSAEVASEEALGFQRTQQGNQAQAGAAKNFASARKIGNDDARAQELQQYYINDKVAATDLKKAQTSSANASNAIKISNRKRMALEAGLKVGTKEFNKFILKDTSPKTTISLGVEQGKAAGFADRMVSSGEIIDKLENAGLSLADKTKNKIPLVGNFLISEEFQQLDQAKRDFINAVLRRESGAVISDSEFANADKQYFPVPGDSQETIEQKRRNRRNTTRGIDRAGIGEHQEETTTNVNLPANVQKALEMYR